MPSDITGTELLEEDHGTGKRSFVFQKGPIFANIVLADEINRAPPKTQAALLEAMQEHRVTAAGKTYTLEEPFFVLATQNPIEQDGTYSLPEAQLDRFMYQLTLGYPSKEEEERIVNTTTGSKTNVIEPVLRGQQIIEIGWRMKVKMELGADRIDIQHIERLGIRQTDRTVHLGLGDLEEPHVTAKIDDPGPIDIGPPHSVLDRKAFHCGHRYGPTQVSGMLERIAPPHPLTRPNEPKARGIPSNRVTG